MDKVYVLISTKKGQYPDVDVFSDADEAIVYAMKCMFGEDWEIQMGDDEYEYQDTLIDAYETLSWVDPQRPYRHLESGRTYSIHGCQIDYPIEVY